MDASRRGLRDGWRGGERGSATAEFAVALPALVVVLVVAISGVQLAADRVRLSNAATAYARMLARGDEPAAAQAKALAAAPVQARASSTRDGPVVRVVIEAPSPFILAGLGLPARVAASASAAMELP